MRVRVVSTTSLHRRQGVPHYTKVEDNDFKCQKNGRHFHERGGQFSPCIATFPQTDPHLQNNSGPTSEVSHTLSSQVENAIMPAARCAKVYNPTNTGAWNSCLRCADNTLRPLQRPLLQLVQKQSIAHPERTHLSDGTANLVCESRLLQPSHRITLHSLQSVTPIQLVVTSKPSLQYNIKRMLCHWRSLVKA